MEGKRQPVRLDVRVEGVHGGGKSNMLVSNLWLWAVGDAMCQEGWGDIAGLWGNDVRGQLSLWHIPVEICLEFSTEV